MVRSSEFRTARRSINLHVELGPSVGTEPYYCPFCYLYGEVPLKPNDGSRVRRFKYPIGVVQHAYVPFLLFHSGIYGATVARPHTRTSTGIN